MPELFIDACGEIVELQASENKLVREYTISLLGQAIKHCVLKKKYIKDRTILFNLLEAHLFDKSVGCRKEAFTQIKALADVILDIITTDGAVTLYRNVISAVTDIKPSIRKLAVGVITELTKSFTAKFKIGSDQEWEQIESEN